MQHQRQDRTSRDRIHRDANLPRVCAISERVRRASKLLLQFSFQGQLGEETQPMLRRFKGKRLPNDSALPPLAPAPGNAAAAQR